MAVETLRDQSIESKKDSEDTDKLEKETTTSTSTPSIESGSMSMNLLNEKIPFKHVTLLREIYIGGGSGAVVYEGLVDGWRCAIKQLEILDIDECNNFLAEIEMLENLPAHPNIVRYLHHDIKGQYLRLFVTQYHSSLRNVIKEKYKNVRDRTDIYFTVKEICVFGNEIIDGLSFLHEQRVLHRDLKSHNVFVMLDSHNQITQLAIGDFDAAKRLTTISGAKSYVGTPDYMAPEVVAQTGFYTHKVDIWSFGMVLYELLTLQRPYHDINFYLVPELIKKGTRPKIESHIPEDNSYDKILNIFQQCTLFDPDTRPELDRIRELIEEILEEEND